MICQREGRKKRTKKIMILEYKAKIIDDKLQIIFLK